MTAARLDRADPAQPLREMLKQQRSRLGLRVFSQRQRQSHRQHARAVDPEIHAVQRQEAPHHEAGAGQQHHRQRDLDHDQRAGPAPGARTAGAAAPAAAVFHHLVEIALRHVQRRGETEQHTGREADRAEEDEDDRIHRERHPVRLADVGGDLRVEPLDAEMPARGRARLRSRPAGRSPPAAAGRCASASRRARRARRSRATGWWRGRAEIGDVGAGDQQHEADGAHQREENEPELRASGALVEGDEVWLVVLVGVRVVVGEARRSRLDLRRGLRQGDAVGEPADRLEVARVALRLAQLGGNLRDRHPQIVVEGELHVGRHHANHRRGEAVDADGARQDPGIAVVAVLPEAVAQDDRGRRADLIVFRPEIAAEDWPLADQLEHVRGVVGALELLRRTAALFGIADVERRHHDQRQPGEGAVVVAPVEKVEA